MSKNHHLNNGGEHPLQGKKHSKDTIKKISEKQIEHCREHGNQFLDHKHSKETICHLSIVNSGREPKWKGRIFEYENGSRKMKLRSSYELFYAKWLDKNNIEWEYEPRYTLSNGMSFSPDFKLFRHSECGIIVEIVEIKGYWTEKATSKWKRFKKDYPELKKRVLMKNDLIKLGMKIGEKDGN